MKKIFIICSMAVVVFLVWYNYRTSLEITQYSVLKSVYGKNAEVNREYIYTDNSIFSRPDGYSEIGHLYSVKEQAAAK